MKVIMSHILKRFIDTATVTGVTHSCSTLKSKPIKAYLEQEGLQEWVDARPALKEAGAETVEVV